MTGKVKCTCGWSWNKSDSSKKDMYICHECGRDNSNNMKNGGWLDNYGEQENYNDFKVSAPEGFVGEGYSNVGRNYSPAWGGQFQMGGSLPGATGHMYARIGAPSNGKYAKKTKASAQDGKKVKYGTPEYEEAYNKGEVITKEGVRSPILLDEVVVKGKKKDKNWLEQYADKIVEENKDAGVLGAILGTPISAVTSLPQLMGMKAITGEMERPSEALDIENPYGAMAVDAIADPANLIGIGELSGLSKLGKEKALAKLVASKESGLLSKIKPTQLNASIDNVKNISTGAFSNLPKATPEQLKNAKGFLQRRQFVKNLQSEGLVGKDFNTADLNYTARFNEKTDALTKLALDRDATFYRGVTVDKEFNPQFNYEGRSFNLSKPGTWTDVSEMENMQKAGVDFNNPESIAQYQATHVPMETYGYRSTGLSTVYDKDFLFMDKRPTSYGNRQFKLKLPRDFSEGNYQEWYDKYYKNKKYVLDLMDRIDTKNMPVRHPWDNYVADVPRQMKKDYPALIGNRGEKIIDIDPTWEVRNYKENPLQYNKDVNKIENQYNTGWRGEYKDGGVIKDDRGQWDHPGEITEINSNDITMEGVPYNVLGISDTGDTKLMKPGKNYKFKGKKVTEYPMARNGINNLDAKPLQKLDQLTNFTNYNTKQPGGWLDNL
jgi:hypothetical protein